MTSLTEYPCTATSATSGTANKLIENTTGATLTNKDTALTALTTGWITVFSQGTATPQTGAGSQPTPSDSGAWIDDGTGLVGNFFLAGTWSFSMPFQMSSIGGTFIADFHFQACRRSAGGSYSVLAEGVASAQTIGSGGFTNVTASVSGSQSPTFASGEKFALFVAANITTNSTAANLQAQSASSSTQGNASSSVTTPGFQAPGTSNYSPIVYSDRF